MGAPVFANRSVCFVAKWGTDDAGYNPVGAPMARLTIAAALADLAANYHPATAAEPHVVAIEPGIYITPAFALPPFTFLTLSHDGPLNPTQGVIILLTGNITLAAGWAVNQTAFGGFANVTIRPNVSQDIDLTMPAPAAGSPARTVILRDVITSCSLAWQATGAGDAIEFNNFSQDGAAADTVNLAGGNIKIRNMESAAVVTMIDTASRVAAVQCYGLQITDPAAGLVCSSVGAGFVARLGNCDLRDLTLNETAPGVITVYADAPSIPLAASLHFTGTATDADLIRTTDTGSVEGGSVGFFMPGFGLQSWRSRGLQFFGKVTLTNGSAVATGVGFTQTQANGLNLQTLGYFIVTDSAGDGFLVEVTVVNDTTATITNIIKNLNLAPVGPPFGGVTGSYDFFSAGTGSAKSTGAIAIGHAAFADGGYSGIAIGFDAAILAGADAAIAIGNSALAEQTEGIAVGDSAVSSAESAQAWGNGVVNAVPFSALFGGYGASPGFAIEFFSRMIKNRFEVLGDAGATDIVIRSPDGTRWAITVSNIGAITAAPA